MNRTAAVADAHVPHRKRRVRTMVRPVKYRRFRRCIWVQTAIFDPNRVANGVVSLVSNGIAG